MPKKVFILTSSARIESNSEKLAQSFAKGAQDAGHEVELIRLANRTIQFCRGCLSCQKTLRCLIKDDMADILEQMRHADVVVFATPIYYYEMSGLMKTFLDRTNPLFPQEYQFRDIYLLATAADEAEHAFDRAIAGLEGWIECFEETQLVDSIVAGGVTGPGDIAGHPALDQAYKAGQNIR